MSQIWSQRSDAMCWGSPTKVFDTKSGTHLSRRGTTLCREVFEAEQE
jgi:hypothetical protein